MWWQHKALFASWLQKRQDFPGECFGMINVFDFSLQRFFETLHASLNIEEFLTSYSRCAHERKMSEP
jgi:hypothetical protein